MVCKHIIRQNERVEPRSERRLSSHHLRPHAAAVCRESRWGEMTELAVG